MTRELAYAKLNLVLHVGRPREDGLHPICSLMASIDLADELTATPRASGPDDVICPGVPGDNLAAQALADFRLHAGTGLPPLEPGSRSASRSRRVSAEEARTPRRCCVSPTSWPAPR